MPYPHARHLNALNRHVCPACEAANEEAEAAAMLDAEPLPPLTRYALASQLRQRLICGGRLPRALFAMPVAQVFALYTTCPACSEQFVTEEQIQAALKAATCAEHWLFLIGQMKAANEEAKLIQSHGPEHGRGH